MKQANRLRSSIQGLTMLIGSLVPNSPYADQIDHILSESQTFRSEYSDNEKAFLEYKNGKGAPANLKNAPVAHRLSHVSSGAIADNLQVERHLLESIEKGHIAHVRMLDAMANLHPGITQDIIQGVQLKLDQDYYRDLGKDIAETVGEYAVKPHIKYPAKIAEVILEEIADVDPNNVEGTDLAEAEQYITNTPIGALMNSEGSPYQTTYVDKRLFLGNDEYIDSMSQDSDIRHELSYKISLLRKVSQGGKLSKDEIQLFPYNPENYRSEIQGMFDTINSVTKDGETVYEPLPDYDEQKAFTKMLGHIIEQTQSQITSYKISHPDIAITLESAFNDSLNVLENSPDEEERNTAYARMMLSLNIAMTESNSRIMDQTKNDLKAMGADVLEIQETLTSTNKRIKSMETSIKDLGRRMQINEEKLDGLVEQFNTFENDFDDRVRNIVGQEIAEAEAKRNFNIAGYNFGDYYKTEWANGTRLAYESTRLIQNIAHLSGNNQFIADAAVIEGTARGVVGVLKGITQLTDALEAMEKAKQIADTAEQLNQAANMAVGMTNMVSAGVMVASMFMDSGPSADEVIIELLQEVLKISQDILKQTYKLEENQKILSHQIQGLQEMIEHLRNDNKEQAQAILESLDFSQGLVNIYSGQIMEAVSTSQIDSTTSTLAGKVVAFNQLLDTPNSNITIPNLRPEIAELSTFLVTRQEAANRRFPNVTIARPANIEEFSNGAYQLPYELTVLPQSANTREQLGQYAYLTQNEEAGSQLIMLPTLLLQIQEMLEQSGRSLDQSQYDIITRMKNPDVVEGVAKVYLAASNALTPHQAVHNDLGKILEHRLSEIAQGNQQLRELVPHIYDLHAEKLDQLQAGMKRYIELYDLSVKRTMLNPVINDPKIIKKIAEIDTEIIDFNKGLIEAENENGYLGWYETELQSIEDSLALVDSVVLQLKEEEGLSQEEAQAIATIMKESLELERAFLIREKDLLEAEFDAGRNALRDERDQLTDQLLLPDQDPSSMDIHTKEQALQEEKEYLEHAINIEETVVKTVANETESIRLALKQIDANTTPSIEQLQSKFSLSRTTAQGIIDFSQSEDSQSESILALLDVDTTPNIEQLQSEFGLSQISAQVVLEFLQSGKNQSEHILAWRFKLLAKLQSKHQSIEGLISRLNYRNMLQARNPENIRQMEDITHTYSPETPWPTSSVNVQRLQGVAEAMGLIKVIDQKKNFPIGMQYTKLVYSGGDPGGGGGSFVPIKHPKKFRFDTTNSALITDLGLEIFAVNPLLSDNNKKKPTQNAPVWYRNWNEFIGKGFFHISPYSSNFTEAEISRMSQHRRKSLDKTDKFITAIRDSLNGKNQKTLEAKIKELVGGANIGKQQLQDTVARFFEETRGSAGGFWEDMLLGKLDDPEYDFPTFIREQSLTEGSPMLEEIASLQSELAQNIQEVTVLQHALKVFIGAGWGECASYIPVLANIASKIESGNIPNFDWLTDESRSKDFIKLYSDLGKIIENIRDESEKIDFLHTVDTQGLCSLGLGDAERNLARVRGLKELQERYITTVAKREY